MISRGAIEERRAGTWLIGRIDEITERIKEYEEAGVQRIVYQLPVGRDHQLVDLLAELNPPAASSISDRP